MRNTQITFGTCGGRVCAGGGCVCVCARVRVVVWSVKRESLETVDICLQHAYLQDVRLRTSACVFDKNASRERYSQTRMKKDTERRDILDADTHVLTGP
jgi:hypothetical protein